MKKTFLLYFTGILLFGAVIYSSCIDKIDFDLTEAVIQALAVDGKLIKGADGKPSVVQVEVLRLANAEVLSSTIAVRDITVENDKGQTFELMKFTDGLFRSEIAADDPNFEINFENQYKIIVNTFDGRKLESSFEGIAKVPSVEEVRGQVALFDAVDEDGTPIQVEKMKFTLDTELQVAGEQGKSRLYWEVLRTYKIYDEISQQCYIQERQSISKFFPVDGNEINGDRLEDHYFFDNPIDYRYGHGAYVTVVQHSLSPDAYEYRRQISDLSVREGSIFENPVGALLSNVKNVEDAADPIFGYFFATQTDTIHTYIDSLTAGTPLPLCQPYRPPPPMTPCFTQCCDCLVENNSTLTKPSFWD